MNQGLISSSSQPSITAGPVNPAPSSGLHWSCTNMCTDKTADKTPQHLKCPETGRLKSKGHGTWDQCDRPDQKNYPKWVQSLCTYKRIQFLPPLVWREAFTELSFTCFVVGWLAFSAFCPVPWTDAHPRKPPVETNSPACLNITEKTSPRWPTVLITQSKVSPFYLQGKVDTSSTFPSSVFSTPLSQPSKNKKPFMCEQRMCKCSQTALPSS